ncbi:MAG TPA: hypothetical protein VF884_10225 [Nitrososphaeraceae archaeon]
MLQNVSISAIVEGDDPNHAIYHDIFLWFKEKFLNSTNRIDITKKLFQFTAAKGYYYMQPVKEQVVNMEVAKEQLKTAFFDMGELLKVLSNTSRFRYTEVGNWLIENHRPFIEEFRGSKMTKSWRLHSKRNYIKKRLDNLIELGLLEKEANVKSSKNELETALYSFTPHGIVAALTNLAFYTTYDKAENKYDILACLGLLDGYWTHVLLIHKSSLNEFLHEFIRDLHNMDTLFSSLEPIFSFLLNHFPNLEYEKIRDWFLFLKIKEPELYPKFVQTLRTVDKNIRDMFLFRLKIDVEYNLANRLLSLPENWEIVSRSNIRNSSVMTVVGNCENCNSLSTILIDFYEFIDLPFRSDDGKIVVRKLNCAKCNEKDSVKINMISYCNYQIKLKTYPAVDL